MEQTLETLLINHSGDLRIGHNGTTEDGKQAIIVHAMGENSETLDFVVDGNTLTPRK